jgi:anti-sigma factor RsiW
MVTCHDAERLIVGEVDDAIGCDERRALEAHLEACAACRRVLSDQMTVAAVLDKRPEDVVPSGFAARVAARIAEEAEGGDGWLGLAEWRVWTCWCAPIAAGLLLVATLLALRGNTASAVTPGTTNADEGASALFLRSDVTDESLLVTVLTGSPSTDREGDPLER